MNVFLIPSWYPHDGNPLEGCFIAEQARAFAEIHPEHRIAVSVCGAGAYHLHFRKPGWPLLVCKRLFSRDEIRRPLPNLIELQRPCLEWTWRLAGGNLKSRLAGAERNLEVAKREMGGIDIIHAHVTYLGGWIAAELARRHRLPFVITEHMGPFPFAEARFLTPEGHLTPWLRQPLEQADAVVAVSDYQADRIASFGLKRPGVIPNVVDERQFRPSDRPAAADPIFLSVASLVEAKGIGELLAAIARNRGLGFRSRHLIAGDGTAAASFRRQAEELGISDQIDWLGMVGRDALPEVFRRADAFVLASWQETFGVVYAEALASGLPVIASRCGGPDTMITPEDGLLIPPRDVDALATALRQMTLGIASFDRQGIRERFLSRFSRPVVAGKLLDLYSSTLAASPPELR